MLYNLERNEDVLNKNQKKVLKIIGAGSGDTEINDISKIRIKGETDVAAILKSAVLAILSIV